MRVSGVHGQVQGRAQQRPDGLSAASRAGEGVQRVYSQHRTALTPASRSTLPRTVIFPQRATHLTFSRANTNRHYHSDTHLHAHPATSTPASPNSQTGRGGRTREHRDVLQVGLAVLSKARGLDRHHLHRRGASLRFARCRLSQRDQPRRCQPVSQPPPPGPGDQP